MSAEEDLVRRTLSETIALHERVKQACREAALYHERAEARARCEVRVEVERVVVTGEPGERVDVLARERQRAACGLADLDWHARRWWGRRELYRGWRSLTTYTGASTAGSPSSIRVG